jgi:hypothetical protein
MLKRIVRGYGSDFYWRGQFIGTLSSNYIIINTPRTEGRRRVLIITWLNGRIRFGVMFDGKTIFRWNDPDTC